MQLKKITLGLSLALAAFAVNAAVPNVSKQIEDNAAAIYKDPVIQKMLTEFQSEEAQKWRFNNLMELARIASPSNYEMRRQKEITRRLVEEWSFDEKDIVTRLDGHLEGAGLQIVDGLPVHNV